MIKTVASAAAGVALALLFSGCATNEGSRVGKGEWRKIEGDILGRMEYVWPDEEAATAPESN